MATYVSNYSNSQAITVAWNSIANAAFAASSAIDNSTTKFVEIMVKVVIKTGAAGTVATGCYNIRIARSTDGGTVYQDNASAELIGTLPAVANATPYIGIFRCANPGSHFKIVMENLAGGTTDTTSGNHTAQFTGIKYDVA